MTSQTLGGHSIHWAMRTPGEQGHLTEFICDRRPALKYTAILFIHLSLLMMTSTVQMLAVCRMSVTYELSYLMTLLFMSSCSSVNGAPNWCLWGQVQFLSPWLSFFSLTLVSCWSIHLPHFVTKLNQNLPSFIHLPLLTMTLTVLILAECRMPVTYILWT